MPDQNELTPKELEAFIRKHNLPSEDATVILQNIERNRTLYIEEILRNDSRVAMCHWRCSIKGHGPIGITKETIELIGQEVTNPGRGQ
jgi:hypothetical protein